MSDNQRIEPRWRCIKEGEVSPYKLTLCLFIRENFLANPQLQLYASNAGTQDENSRRTHLDKLVSPKTMLLIYRLISSNDLSFTNLKDLIEDPKAQVRPEVLKRFMKIIANLEDGSVGFLHELFHSIIDCKSSQIIVLRKKLEKNSPFGKFVRLVLMNVRRMSYPQLHYLYRQLTIYVGDYVRMRRKSVGLIPTDLKIHFHTPLHPPALKEKEKENKEPTPATPTTSAVTTSTPTQTPTTTTTPVVILSDIATSTPSTSTGAVARSCRTGSKIGAQANPYKFRGLEIFQRMTDRTKKSGHHSLSHDLFLQYTTEYKRATGKWSIALERGLNREMEEKKKRVALSLQMTKSLSNLWKGNPLLRTASQASLDSFGDPEHSGFGGRPAPKRRSSGRPTPIALRPLPPRSPRKPRNNPLMQQQANLQELNPLTERDDGYLPSDDEDTMGPPPPYPTTPRSPRSKSKSKPKSTKKSSPTTQYCPPPPSIPIITPTTSSSDLKIPEWKVLPNPKNWEHIRWWSRRQIERTFKQLASDLLTTSKYTYTNKEITTFIEMIVQNPTAQILLSQIYYIDYLNCLRQKDIHRCSDALRTSFDIRIKPNTSELNKGVPYAPYNFAVLYNIMGYRKDALLCLEEAFRAGHGAADPTCLHYCHNMWSCMNNKPYTDAIVTVTKEVDNNMAYLHSLNVISNAYDYHFQKQPPEEVLYTLWHYNAECDLEEMESLLLLSLSGFFQAFGWHEMVSFPCQIILHSKLRWPVGVYCKAIVILADTLQLRGEIGIPHAIMDYGLSLFENDTTPVGECFGLRYAQFHAFQAYLGYKPVPDDILGTLHSYNKIFGYYWLAYTKMVTNEWEQASHFLSILSRLLKEAEISCENNDLKIRCLLLMAELQCLSGSPAAALGHIYEALEMAYAFCADHFITLCLSHIASIQCSMGLASAASATINKEMRCAIRSTNPWLSARLTIVTAKINLMLQETISKHNEELMMGKLDLVEKLYKKWGNKYRLKELYYLKAECLDKSEDPQHCGDSFRKSFEGTQCHLLWSSATCLL